MPLLLAASKSSVHLDMSAGVWILIAAVLLVPSFVVPSLYLLVSTRRAKGAANHPSSVSRASAEAVTADEVTSDR